MKRLLLLSMLLICFSCLTEESADPGKSSTFFRYFNGGYDDQAQAFEETPDKGFTILATTQITKTNVSVQNSKIKLIKTDRYGTRIWQTLYPAFGDLVNTSYYKGRGFLAEKDINDEISKYTIVGDKIDKSTGVPYLFILQTDGNGIPIASKEVVSYNNGMSVVSLANVEGQSITKLSTGNYLVLASRSNANATEDMVLAEFNKDNLNLEWLREYGESGSTYVTGLFTQVTTPGDTSIFWAGTVKKNSDPSAIRFIRTAPNAEGTIFDRPIGESEFNEEIGGICHSGSRFNLVGTTDENGNKDILYSQLSPSGDPSLTKIIGDEEPQEGNAICKTDDGGLLIIGTTGLDEEKDYYLIKLNFKGDVKWSKVFGSLKADKGVSVKQVSDGSYVILGSTTLGGLGAIMLMKTDSRGNIE